MLESVNIKNLKSWVCFKVKFMVAVKPPFIIYTILNMAKSAKNIFGFHIKNRGCCGGLTQMAAAIL